MEMKKCSKCQEIKNISEFYKNNNDKLLSYCKICRKKQVSKRTRKIAESPKNTTKLSKICFSCKQEKNIDQFYKNNTRIDGLTDECKECAKNKAKESKIKYSSGEVIHIIRESKICYVCGMEKIISEYSENRSMPDGHVSECKKCASAYHKAYRLSHPDQMKGYSYAYRTRKNNSTFEYFNDNDVIELYGDKCFYCGGEYEHLDHFMPLSKGGSHTLGNVRPACKTCNLRKNASLPEVWMAKIKNGG